MIARVVYFNLRKLHSSKVAFEYKFCLESRASDRKGSIPLTRLVESIQFYLIQRFVSPLFEICKINQITDCTELFINVILS